MQRRNQRTNPRQIATRHNPRRWAALKTNIYPEPAPCRENPLPRGADRSNSATGDATLEFGRLRVLLRERQLLADGAPVELGTRAFDLLLVLLEADGSLVTKEELLRQVWPGIVVSEENLKVQVSALRKALGADRECHPHGIRPRLSLHRRALHESSDGRASTGDAAKAAVWPAFVSTTWSANTPV
jgi:DNA-binding response OmpR family regulator